MRRRRIHVSYEEEEDTCVCTQGTKHVSYEEEEDPPHTGHKALSSSYLNHMYPPPHTGHKALSSSYLNHMYPPPCVCK
jgi:hypothetical protein